MATGATTGNQQNVDKMRANILNAHSFLFKKAFVVQRFNTKVSNDGTSAAAQKGYASKRLFSEPPPLRAPGYGVDNQNHRRYALPLRTSCFQIVNPSQFYKIRYLFILFFYQYF